MKTIYGELIRKQREEKGLSLPELADRCLIRQEYLQLAEDGEPVLGRTDLVILCNVLDISSVALEEGRLIRKPDLPELDRLIQKLEEKADELQESIKEMKAAAASLTIMTQAKALELKEAAPEAGKTQEFTAETTKTEEPKIQAPSL